MHEIKRDQLIPIIEKFVIKAVGHKSVFIINRLYTLETKSKNDHGDLIVDMTLENGRYLIAIKDNEVVAAQRITNEKVECKSES